MSKAMTGFWIDADIAARPGLTPAAKLVVGLVAGMVRLYGSCEATSGYMARCLKLDRSTVDTALAALEAAGLIERRTTRTPFCTMRVITLGTAYPKKPAPLPEKAAGVPENPWSLDRTERSIKEDEEGVAKALPLPPFENRAPDTRRKPDSAVSSGLQEMVTPAHVRFVRDWSAQVVMRISNDDAQRRRGNAKPKSDYAIHPASDRAASDPVFMRKAVKEYPGSADPMVFRQHLRRTASTAVLREALAANVTKGYARSRFGADELGVDALTMAGRSRKMPVLSQGFYGRPAPEPITDAQLAAVTEADVAEVMRHLEVAKWGAACWLPCVRELAVRAKHYGVALDDYLECADAVQKRYPETPYLWIADSVTRPELDEFLAGRNRGGTA